MSHGFSAHESAIRAAVCASAWWYWGIFEEAPALAWPCHCATEWSSLFSRQV